MSAPRPMLFCLSGSLKGATIAPREAPVTIGTATSCTVRFPPSESRPVAGEHAVIEAVDDGFKVRSLSGEPILVNEAPVMEARLAQNDLIRLGERGPVLRFRVSETRRVTKTFHQMVADSRGFASESSRRPTRASRMTSFARQLVKEAVANGTRRFRIGFIVMGALIFLLAAVLVRNTIEGEKSKDRLRDEAGRLEDENEQLRQDLEAGRSETERLKNALLEEAKGRDELLTQLRALVERERARDSSLRDLANRTKAATDEISAMKNMAQAARNIHAEYHPGVCFIYVGISFYNPRKKQFVRYAVDPANSSAPASSFPVTLGGTGPKLIEWVSGSGFLVSKDGLVISNRHVIDPWFEDKDFGGGLLQRDYKTVREAFIACFPGREEPVELQRVGAHPKMDIACARLTKIDPKLPVLKLAKGDAPNASGTTIVLLGYPEGIRGLINKLESKIAKAAIIEAKGDRRLGLVKALARRSGIRPTMTLGVLSDANPEQLVYDAVTFSGGSGGPLFEEGGTVIGVNTAISRQFTGANYGLPIAFARQVIDSGPLKKAVYATPEIAPADAVVTPPEKPKAPDDKKKTANGPEKK